MSRTQTLLKTAEVTANIRTKETLEFFNSRVIGQPESASALVNVLQARAVGFVYGTKRPIANVFMLGPTGVGKTETAKVLAEFLHGNPELLVRIDCAEFQHSHEIAKLIGSPPGYLGHKETHPALSQEVINSVKSDNNKISVILFDEVEKSSDALFKLLLGIMDNGVLTLGDNKKVFFNDCIILFTSNIGVTQPKDFNFVKSAENTTKVRTNNYEAALKKKLPPEFYNRIDCSIVFNNLTKADINKIFDVVLEKVLQQTDPNSVLRRTSIRLSDKLHQTILDEGYSTEYGARYLARAIFNRIKMPLAKAECDDNLLTSAYYNSKTVKLDIKNGNVILSLIDKVE